MIFVVKVVVTDDNAAAVTAAVFLIAIEVDRGGAVFVFVFVFIAAADVTKIDDDDPATYSRIHTKIHDDSW